MAFRCRVFVKASLYLQEPESINFNYCTEHCNSAGNETIVNHNECDLCALCLTDCIQSGLVLLKSPTLHQASLSSLLLPHISRLRDNQFLKLMIRLLDKKNQKQISNFFEVILPSMMRWSFKWCCNMALTLTGGWGCTYSNHWSHTSVQEEKLSSITRKMSGSVIVAQFHQAGIYTLIFFTGEIWYVLHRAFIFPLVKVFFFFFSFPFCGADWVWSQQQ